MDGWTNDYLRRYGVCKVALILVYFNFNLQHLPNSNAIKTHTSASLWKAHNFSLFLFLCQKLTVEAKLVMHGGVKDSDTSCNYALLL